MHSHTHTLQYS